MEDKNETTVHYRKLSWRTKLAERKYEVLIGLMLFICSFVCSFTSTIAGPTALRLVGLQGLLAFVIFGLIFGLGGALAFTKISRKLFSKDKILLAALQEKAVVGATPLTMEETHLLIDRSLKLNHQLVSDFYSKQVLALSMLNSEDAVMKQTWMISSDCWASTGEFDKQWKKKMWFLYETRGILTLSPSVFNFQSKKFTFECDPLQIKSVEVRKHPLWIKPIPCKYLYITIDDSGCEHSFVLTPSMAVTDTVWDGNKMVDEWVIRIESVRYHPIQPS
ncbi:MAG: hypothetical protein P4L53_01625 [Candidatus Obscuribacterales bacterium]|nr:hypothetical protein [Candidatus Obscuribacterales bacterium]